MEHSVSELLGRLSRKDRTPKIKVLLALGVLGAVGRAKAVDSSAIARQLKLSLGKSETPGNVPAVLRRAAPYADCVGVGERELRWFLTPTGLKLLKQEFAWDLTPDSKATHDFDLAIVCALHRPELTAVMAAFGGEGAWQAGPNLGQPHIYKVTEIGLEDGGSIRIIAGAPTYMGLTATAILATQMLLLFKPRMIVAVGIAAGTKSTGRGYGDVLIPDPSVDYASGKVTHTEGADVFAPDPFPLPIDARLRTLVQEDIRTRDGLDDITSAWKGSRPSTPLNVHIGPVGAADQVVDSAKRVAEVQRNWRKLIGIEMETYALYRAAHEAPHPRPLFMAFKGVCDFAAAKEDAWQEYAAHVAAAYAYRFLAKNWRRPGLGLMAEAAA